MITIGDGYQKFADPGFVYDETDPRTYQDQYLAWQLCRDTVDCDLTNYPGSGGQQKNVRSVPEVIRDPRAAQRDRMLSRRREDLL